MRCNFNSIKYYLSTSFTLFLEDKYYQCKPHSVYALVILFAMTELSFYYKINRCKLKAYRIRPKSVFKQHQFVKNLQTFNSLITML